MVAVGGVAARPAVPSAPSLRSFAEGTAGSDEGTRSTREPWLFGFRLTTETGLGMAV